MDLSDTLSSITESLNIENCILFNRITNIFIMMDYQIMTVCIIYYTKNLNNNYSNNIASSSYIMRI